MQINIKVKFDKKNKHLNWCKKQGAFFLQNNEMKNQLISPDKKQLHSFIQQNQQNNTDEKQLIHTYRQIINNKDIHQSSKPSTLKKRSKSKNSRRSNGNDSGRKTERVRKNVPDLMKISKQKILVNTNIGNILEDQSFRGTLPGLSGKKVIQRFTPMLSEQQKIELINEKVVYYLGLGVGIGQDDINGNYIWKKYQQIGYRYQLLQVLGNGVFGEVVKAYDHKNRQNVALKIIKSKKEHMQLALNQINILMKTKEKDIDNEKNILRIKDFIVFKKHICIITEILSISLYELLQNNKFMSIQMHYIRTFAIQILNALSFLRENKIIHSDLKPENILLKNRSKTGIKVIDFGASMFSHQNSFFYIQSRFYRAPEVILGATYDYSIDMWSFGCLLAQLYLGVPLFAGKNQQEQFSLIVQSLGIPSVQFLSNCKNRHCYFTKDMNPKLTKNQNGKIITPKSKPLNQQIHDKIFVNYLLKILIIDPKQRLTPLQALLQPWIMSQMPEDIKQQHMKYMTNKLKKQIEDSQKKSNINKKKNINKTNKHRKRNSDLQMKPPIPIITHKRRCSQGFH